MVLVRHVYEEVGTRLAACSNCMLATLGQSATAVNRKERSAADMRRASSTLTPSVPTANASNILAPAGCIATIQDRSGRVIAGQSTARKSSTNRIAGISFRIASPLIQPEALPWLQESTLRRATARYNCCTGCACRGSLQWLCCELSYTYLQVSCLPRLLLLALHSHCFVVVCWS